MSGKENRTGLPAIHCDAFGHGSITFSFENLVKVISIILVYMFFFRVNTFYYYIFMYIIPSYDDKNISLEIHFICFSVLPHLTLLGVWVGVF